jgi:deoxyribodipyrimidine photo-lyase
LLSEFLTVIPKVKKHAVAWPGTLPPIDWTGARKSLRVDKSAGPVTWLSPGERAAHKTMRLFLEKKLAAYDEFRNNPIMDAQSHLSPYLHFGQISAQRVAFEAQRYDGHIKPQEAFLEQLIIRKELSDNFCFYNDKYDSFEGFPAWARKSLNEHRGDIRPYVYSRDQLETGKTHDDLWNAVQAEMVISGKTHGYLRMYWAKKILEWSRAPEEALAAAIYLNDKYSLDGRDPNGYAGIAWSIGGIHDRPWFERGIIGKIRYMSYSGCRRKFDVRAYIARVESLPQGSRV